MVQAPFPPTSPKRPDGNGSPALPHSGRGQPQHRRSLSPPGTGCRGTGTGPQSHRQPWGRTQRTRRSGKFRGSRTDDRQIAEQRPGHAAEVPSRWGGRDLTRAEPVMMRGLRRAMTKRPLRNQCAPDPDREPAAHQPAGAPVAFWYPRPPGPGCSSGATCAGSSGSVKMLLDGIR